MHAPSTSAPTAHAFGPQTFLNEFTQRGGGYWITPEGRLCLGCICSNVSDADRSTATAMMRSLTKEEIEALQAFATGNECQSSEQSDRSLWDETMHQLTEAEASLQAFQAAYRVLDDERCKLAEAVPHVALRPDPQSGNSRVITTADTDFVRRARKVVKDVAEGRMHFDPIPSLQDHYVLCCDVVAAADDRAAKIAAIDDRLGYRQAVERYEALSDREYDARWALMGMPAPDHSALGWKLRFLLEDDSTGSCGAWSNDALKQTRADIERLLGTEA